MISPKPAKIIWPHFVAPRFGAAPHRGPLQDEARSTKCYGRSLGRRASKNQGVLQTIICLIRRYMGLYKVIGICGHIRFRAGPAKDKA